MADTAKTRPKVWTYEDYAALADDGRRYEVLQGELCEMTPAPTPYHQLLQARLTGLFVTAPPALEAGQVLPAPCDVVLPDGSVVQPDLLFVSAGRLDIITEACVRGVPDLVIEILSGSHPARDRIRKLELYAANGVPNYWIVDPESRTLEAYELTAEGRYARRASCAEDDTFSPALFPGLKISLPDLFARPQQPTGETQEGTKPSRADV